MHSRTKKRQCLLCLKPLYQEVSLYHVLYHPKLCVSCLQKFVVWQRRGTIDSYPILVMYQYNDFFRQLLYQYKGLYDVALKDVFLDVFKEEFKRIYRGYVIVIVPSSDIAIRGFNPNVEIVKTFSNCIFSGLYKQIEYKQTNQVDRRKVMDVIALRDGERIRGKKLLVFDDVITSGYTIRACLRVLERYHPLSIEILALATKSNRDNF